MTARPPRTRRDEPNRDTIRIEGFLSGPRTREDARRGHLDLYRGKDPLRTRGDEPPRSVGTRWKAASAPQARG